MVENGFVVGKEAKEEVKVNGEEIPGWHQQLCMLISRASRAYPGHWPIPEAFWPETVTSTLVRLFYFFLFATPLYELQ